MADALRCSCIACIGEFSAVSAPSVYADSFQRYSGPLQPLSVTQEVATIFGISHASSSRRNGPDQIIPTTHEWVTDLKEPVRIRLGTTGLEMFPPISVPTLLKQRAEKFPDRIALRSTDDDGRQREWTFKQYADDVRACAKGLIALGLPRFGAVCILGQNSPQWAIAALGTIHAGGIAAGLYDTDSSAQCKYVADLLKSVVAFVQDEKQAAKMLAVRRQLPNLQVIVQWSGRRVHDDVLWWEDLLMTGSSQADISLNERLRLMAINHCCMVICTSGSTGNPKAAMLTHDYCVMTAVALEKHADAKLGKEQFMSFMPFNHASGSIFELFASLVAASTMTFAPDALRGDLLKYLRQVRPTQMFAVPRHYEKLASTLMAVEAEYAGDVGFDWARRVTLQFHQARVNGEPTRNEALAYKEAKALYLEDVKREMGLDRAHFLIAGGAPIHPKLVELFLSFDIQLFQEYGLTEVGATNIEHPTCFAPGSVGPVLNGCNVVVEKLNTCQLDGEILFNGRIRFMGYACDENRTLEMFDPFGRVKSGDLGHFDDRGRLFITGRIKDLIVTSGGKKISPRPIEVKLHQLLHPAVSNIMVVGEGRKFISALFCLKTECDEDSGLPTDTLAPVAQEWLRSLGSCQSTISEVLRSDDEKVFVRIQQAVTEYNEKHANSSVESVKKWLLLPTDFTLAGGELNNLLKLKRAFIEAKYSREIDALYDDSTTRDE